MKKFLSSALLALMLLGFGATTCEACCGGNYCYSQDCNEANGEYCGRYGCGR